ncbi:MAG: GNAT family N-acetyltransferase, partial [Bacilli bacterium]|nr:GNAT family N-acetyltransferase [Bacilli bacterium]
MRKIRLDENIINKYESEYRSLKHLRTSDDYTGYFYLYNNKPVGYINVNKVTNTIQAMEIFKDFQGMGLSEDLMKDWKALKGDNLTVNKDNNVAIAIYKKHGFRTYKTTDTMLFMKLPSSKIQQIKEFSDVMIVYPDCLEESYINEASGNANSILLRKLMYAERFRTPKEVFAIYDQVKADFPWISKTYLTYNKYLMYNMFIDLSFYNQTFFKNNIYKLDKGIDLYFDFINRFLNDARLLSAGYTNRTVIIPVNDWKSEGNIWMYNEDVNPISMITRLAMTTPEKFRDWAGINFVFTSDNAYFKIDFTTFDTKSVPLFLGLIKKLKNNEQPIDDPKDNTIDSKQAIVADIIDKIETSQKIKINNLTGSSGEITKDELVQKVTQAASVSTDVEQALDQLDKDEKLKGIIAALAMEEDNTIKLNAARTARMTHLNDEFLNKEINKKPIRDLLKEPKKDELLVTTLKIDSVNPEWQEMRYMNFEKSYDVDADIVKILMSFSEKSIPIAIRDISVTDESTAEDWIYTYNIQCEDGLGQRFTLKFDIPKIKDSKFMLLRGNEKTINGQLVQIPIMKTDEDTVQIVSNYNKIFVRRFGTTTGKSFVSADKIIKCLNKYQGKGITITRGDNSKISMKYDLPIDYIDIGSEFSIIETKNCIIYFSQDEIRSKYKIDDKKKGIPFGYSKDTKEVIYYNSEEPISDIISYHLTLDGDFRTLYTEAKPASKYTYSKASILNTEIPVIVVMGYTCGLIGALSKAGIEYQIEDKKPKDPTKDFIKFKDGYINYTLDYNSSLLMNGLKDCNTEDYLLADMNSKTMWLDFLDLFGGRIKADGLDNFTDLMIDPITDEVLDHYKLPVDYMELLAYANHLLEDNKFIKHTSTAGRRYRSNEIIAGYVYKALSEAYGDFKNKSKRISKGNTMTIKQSDVIDKILLDPTASDLSILNPLLEIESANAISYKGLSGMNSDRAYSLDKRTFDDSMLNVLALSTGFAGNVGITRQATVDMNIEGKRGYIKEIKDKNNLSVTKTLCMTEALTPFGTTRDDPFRSAMTFIQTSKHGMRIRNSCPQLITNGADEALPYMISNTFAHKSKMAGKVVEKTDDYMILAYKDGSNEMVSL